MGGSFRGLCIEPLPKLLVEADIILGLLSNHFGISLGSLREPFGIVCGHFGITIILGSVWADLGYWCGTTKKRIPNFLQKNKNRHNRVPTGSF